MDMANISLLMLDNWNYSNPFVQKVCNLFFFLLKKLRIHTFSSGHDFTTTAGLQSTSLFLGHYIVFGTVDISVISQPKLLKFGVQAHLLKMIGHTNFQLSISCTFKVMKLLVEVKVEQNLQKLKELKFLQIRDVI